VQEKLNAGVPTWKRLKIVDVLIGVGGKRRGAGWLGLTCVVALRLCWVFDGETWGCGRCADLTPSLICAIATRFVSAEVVNERSLASISGSKCIPHRWYGRKMGRRKMNSVNQQRLG
jgi:hypothetical protein